MTETQHAASQRAKQVIGLVLVGLIALAIPLTHLRTALSGIPFNIGANFIWCAMLWFAAIMLIPRARSVGWGLALFGVIAFGSTFSTLAAAGFALREAQAATGEMSANYENLVAGRPVAAPTAGLTPMATANALMAQYMRDLASLGARYTSEIQALNLPSLVDPAQIASQRNESDFDRKTAKALSLIDQYRTQNLATMDQMRARIVSSSLPDDVKTGMLRGFDATHAQGRAMVVRQWGDEAGLVRAMQKDYRLLFREKGAWTLRGHSVLFQHAAALSEFNAISGEIGRLAADEKRVRSEADAAARDRLSTLRRAVQ